MTTHPETSDILSDAELADVNGGAVALAAAVGAAFGFAVGVIVKERTRTISMGELLQWAGY